MGKKSEEKDEREGFIEEDEDVLSEGEEKELKEKLRHYGYI